jgi:hypothetical protein
MYKFFNENPLNKFTDDCVIRSISCATHRSWDEVYDEMSDLAQFNGTLFDQRDFVLWYLDSNYERVPYLPKKVGEVAQMYKNHIILCTMRGHICCIKYGVIYDTFNPSERIVEDAWIVE